MSFSTENSELNINDSVKLNPAPNDEQTNNKLIVESVVVNNSDLIVSTLNLTENNENPNDADSDNESLNNCTIKNKKKHNLIDSDSEDEPSSRPDPDSASESGPEYREKENITPNEFQTPEKKKKSRLRKMSDDSDSENEAKKTDNTNVSPVKDVLKVNDSVLTEINNMETQKSRLNQLIDSDSEDESKLEEQIINENIDEDVLQKEQAIRLKNLCDSESSADETSETPNSPELKMKKNQKSRKKSEPCNGKTMTGRDAMEQMRQIKSESQKMVRESRVSLPYHLPKQHTLQEFLKRRSLVPDVIDVQINKSTTFAIKHFNSSQEIVKAAERLKEREKEIEEFYKDESDESENEEATKESEVMEQKPPEAIQDKTEENVESSSNIIMAIDSILESAKQLNEDDNPTGEEIQPQTNIISQEKSNEETSKIEELRNVLIQYSCGNDSNMEQLVEEPEKMDCPPDAAAEVPQDSEISKDPEPAGVVEQIEDAPEKLSEDFIDSHFTANFRQIEVIETPKETPNKEDELEKKLKNLNPIISLKKDFTPRLTGDGGDFVVLDDGLERSKGVSNLMKRFFLHTSNKSTPKKDVPEVEATAHQEIEMEHEPDEAAKKNLTPGLKFKKLKANLEEQIVLKRLEEWKKKQDEFKMDSEGVEGEKSECGLDAKILDEEDEEDISDEESSEESEEEEEEDDVVLKDKPQVKSAFVDDEAEESDIDTDDSEESDDDPVEETTEKKPLKRIIQVFDEDSDDENKENSGGPEENDEEITAYQPQQTNGLEKTPCKPVSDISTFLTPTLHLTALQGMGSTTKSSIHESPGIALSPDPSPLRMHPLLKTKLFTETEDANLEELENLCSGKFTGPTQRPSDLTTQENNLLNLCSGKFTGLATDAPQKNPEDLEAPEASVEDNQFQITFDNDSLDEKLSESTSDIRNSQNDVNQEVEDVTEVAHVAATQTEVPKLHVTKFVLASSDEDEETETKVQSKKSKAKRKYVIDDISISEDEDTANQDDFSEDEEESSVKNVNYDSEENEVEYVEMEEEDAVDKEAAKKARDYFEAEAELSGSDWDSADEDEKGLDDFEAEDGDADKISEKKLQRELGRIHAHTVLEEDKRDVKLLQELLLEDGELHGAGREKKFKWKNADSATWNDENRPKDDDEEIDETENELEWRKMRYEREMFLKEQQAKKQHHQEDEEEILANDSQIMQLGKEALEKSLSLSNSSLQHSSQLKTPITESVLADPDIKLPFTLTHKRGSFLMRSETTLARLAEITRNAPGALINGAKNSRNFVFTTIQKTETLVVEESSEKKRKADSGTPKILKKMRIAESPAQKKNKKLF